jgi:hypothetical protein
MTIVTGCASMKIPYYYTEIILDVVAFFWLWFVLTNSNANLGNVYLWAAAISIILFFINKFIFNKQVQVTYQKKAGGTFEAILAGAVGWVILLAASFFILKFVDPTKSTLGAIIGTMNAANPAFSNSVTINWLTVSLAIGYTETMLFSRGMEFLSDIFGIPINKKSKYLFAFLIMIFLLAIGFSIYHSTAKGVENLPSLVVVAIMMFISLIMVAHFDGETRQSVWLHWIANGVAGALLIMAGGLVFT